MRQNIIALVSGIIFALGLVISGMVNPAKVKGFLDIFGEWDISLAFVMVGSIGFNFFAFKAITKNRPRYSEKFYLPEKTYLDKKLIFGSALFGIGWGLVGICPGPGIVNLATLKSNALLFILAMSVGVVLSKFIEKFTSH